ncbi:hypothetical protein [Paragemmobacter aquarius]|uniref:hypothetical protein n=1 Tax=Paragemmobacter aquarius TaxID=2169400 RepID=UPI001C1F9076|nr:hypothetical protein [Gemmobacter aquarius]
MALIVAVGLGRWRQAGRFRRKGRPGWQPACAAHTPLCGGLVTGVWPDPFAVLDAPGPWPLSANVAAHCAGFLCLGLMVTPAALAFQSRRPSCPSSVRP